MRNLLFRICYKGTNYHGYQVQKNALTIAEMLHRAFEQMTGVRDHIVGCSRTDAGVHANEYYFNMHTASNIACERFVMGLNRFLPDDIAVLECREADAAFHARYCAVGKEYIYQIWNNPIKNPFYENLALQHRKRLDIELLNAQAQALVGTHDFACFCSAGADAESTVRTIYHASFVRDGALVTFCIRGDGFLYNMVRAIVGTLLQIHDGQLPKDSLCAMMESKDRARAGKTAAACGLYLNRVFYDQIPRD